MSTSSPPVVFDIARLAWADAKVAHCLLPRWRAGEGESVAERGSIAVAFTPQAEALVRVGAGPVRRVSVPSGSSALGGDEPVRWLQTDRPSDLVEITASEPLRQAVADEWCVPFASGLENILGWSDALVLAYALRLRAAARSLAVLGDVERDTLLRAMYARVFKLCFGGRARERSNAALSRARLARVVEFAQAHRGETITLARLAAEAALSPFHFAKAFKKSTGMAPHQFVTLLRLQRAREMLEGGGASVAAAAAGVGFDNVRWFRRLFRIQYGFLPSQLDGRR